MPTLSYVNMIFLGTYSSIDNDESDYSSDDAQSLLGTYDDLQMIQVGEHDRDDSGSIEDDEAMGSRSGEDRDFLDYDVGYGYEEYEIDSTNAYTADVLLADGSTVQVTVAVIQTTIGDVFVRDVNNSLDNLDIRSIQLTSVQSTNYSGSRTYNSIEGTEFVCFAAGTLIDTPGGPIAVENLRKGHLVVTLDNGLQPIQWIGKRHVERPGQNAPVRIEKDALGDGIPSRTLHVSPQHRLLVRSIVARRMFDRDEVLVPAKKLLGLQGVHQQGPDHAVTYVHFLCRRHEVVFADGAPAETLLTGPMALRALPPVMRNEIRAVLRGGEVRRHGADPARPIPSGRRIRRLLERLQNNGHPVVGTA